MNLEENHGVLSFNYTADLTPSCDLKDISSCIELHHLSNSKHMYINFFFIASIFKNIYAMQLYIHIEKIYIHIYTFLVPIKKKHLILLVKFLR